MRRVSLIDLGEQHAALLPALRGAFERVATSARFVGGPEVEALETEIATRTGANYAVGCGSGTDALIVALLAEGVGPGDQVIVPALSFFSTAGAVALLGATPIFADIEAATFGLDPQSAAERAEGCTRLRAVVPVHLYGGPTPLEDLRVLAKSYGAALIEDAAQALGAHHADGVGVGAGSDAAACFSFYPTKNLGALGEAGCLCTDSAERAERLRRLRNHGSEGGYEHREVGLNARLDALQAAFLREKLEHFEGWSERRRANARDYQARLRDLGAAVAQPDETRPEAHRLPVVLPADLPSPGRHAFHQYVVRVPADRRDALRASLDAAGIDTAVYYPRGLHRERCFEARETERGPLPETERACREVVAIPIHPSLRQEDRERVVAAIAAFFLR